MDSRSSQIKFIFVVLVSLFMVAACSKKKTVNNEKPATGQQQVQPVHGVWMATVLNLDWPPRASLTVTPDEQRVELQKKALTDKLDNLVATGINTVFFQVKPNADALYRSAILPWPAVLTGQAGKDPGYDPLAFVITEAHKRGLKLHAWLNPYRVSMNTTTETRLSLEDPSVKPASVYAVHRDWIRIASDRFVLDPGLPEVRDWITKVVAELVRNYNVDGIQFDDYFYYETAASPLNDNETYRQYGGNFTDKGDWRRNNTLLLIKEVANVVKATKPQVEFGISPAGVWRNKADDSRGSETAAGAPTYDAAWADTRLWVKEGLLDYIVPQIYWPFARKVAPYGVLVNWWADVVRSTKTKLYIGMALYKVGTETKNEPDWTIDGGVPELKRELDLNDALPEVKGSVLFREDFLIQPQTQQAVSYLKTRWKK